MRRLSGDREGAGGTGLPGDSLWSGLPNESPQPTRSITTGMQARRWLAVFRLLGKATVVK